MSPHLRKSWLALWITLITGIALAEESGVPLPESEQETPVESPSVTEEPLSIESISDPEKAEDPLYVENSSQDEAQSIAKYHEYEQHLPSIGVSLTASMEALGKEQPIGSNSGRASAGSLELEYQPQVLQSAGVFGLGLSGAIYPVGNNSAGQNNAPGLSIWSVGGQIRYQGVWWISQSVVPMVAWQFEQLFYSLQDNARGNFIMSGPALGLWILLNTFEPSSAGHLYADTGISRSYLVAEWRDRSGSDALVNIAGASWYGGLRLEF